VYVHVSACVYVWQLQDTRTHTHMRAHVYVTHKRTHMHPQSQSYSHARVRAHTRAYITTHACTLPNAQLTEHTVHGQGIRGCGRQQDPHDFIGSNSQVQPTKELLKL